MSSLTLGSRPRGSVPHAARRTRAGRRGRRRGRVALWTSCAVIAWWVLVAIAQSVITPHDPNETSLGPPLQGPSSQFWLGTDDLGRDVLSRLLAGARDVMTVAPAATALTMLAGCLIGLTAAYVGGRVDDLIMRVTEVFLVLPPMVVAVMVLSALGSSHLTLILVVAQFGVPSVARTVRTAAMREVYRDYVTAARMRGERVMWVSFREVLPNLSGPLLVESTVRLSWAFFASASLSFLGMSLQPPSSDWGLTITVERAFLQVQPWAALGPTLALASLMIAVGVLADQVRRRLALD